MDFKFKGRLAVEMVRGVHSPVVTRHNQLCKVGFIQKGVDIVKSV